MANIKGSVSISGVATGTAAKTILQIVAAANHRVIVPGFVVSFAGTVATDAPVLVELLRQTTAGTMSAATPVKTNSADDETLQTTAQHTSTGEPTAGDILFKMYIHPQSGGVIVLPDPIVVPGGTRLGLRVTVGTSQTMAATLPFEE
jgi:hypothetical protein